MQRVMEEHKPQAAEGGELRGSTPAVPEGAPEEATVVDASGDEQGGGEASRRPGGTDGKASRRPEVMPEKEVKVDPKKEVGAEAKRETGEAVEEQGGSRRPGVKGEGGKKDAALGNVATSSKEGEIFRGEYATSPAEAAALEKAEAYRQTVADKFRKKYRITSKTPSSQQPQTPKKAQSAAAGGKQDTPNEKPNAKARAKRGTAGTFCGRKPPKNPQAAEEFRRIRDAWIAQQAATKTAKAHETKMAKAKRAKTAEAKGAKTAKAQAVQYFQEMRTIIATLKKINPNKAGSWYVQEANKQIRTAKSGPSSSPEALASRRRGVVQEGGGRGSQDRASGSQGVVQEEEEDKEEREGGKGEREKYWLMLGCKPKEGAKGPDGRGTWKRWGDKWELVFGLSTSEEKEEKEEKEEDKEEEEEEEEKEDDKEEEEEEEDNWNGLCDTCGFDLRAIGREANCPKCSPLPEDEGEGESAVAKRPAAKQPAVAKRPAKSQRRQEVISVEEKDIEEKGEAIEEEEEGEGNNEDIEEGENEDMEEEGEGTGENEDMFEGENEDSACEDSELK